MITKYHEPVQVAPIRLDKFLYCFILLFSIEILLYHGINHTHFSVDLNDGDKFTTFQGDIIIIVDDNSGGMSYIYIVLY